MKKSWKYHYQALLDNLPALGIDGKDLQKDLNRLPEEPIDVKKYMKLSQSALRAIANIKTYFMFLFRDFKTIKNAAIAIGDVALEQEVDALMPLLKNARKTFNKWNASSYPQFPRV